MWVTLLGLLLFVLIAVPVFPLPRVRCIVLGLLHRASHLVVLVVVVASAAFFAVPEWTPVWAGSLADVALQRLGGSMVAANPQWVWLLIAGTVVVVTLPLLSLLDFARRVTSLTALVGRLLGDIRDTGRRLAAAIAEGEASRNPVVAARAADLKSAVESMQRLTKVESQSRPRRCRLIELVSQ